MTDDWAPAGVGPVSVRVRSRRRKG